MNDRRMNRYWGDRTPPENKVEFFNAITIPTPAGEGDVATIRLYGPVDSWGGFWGISAKDVSEVLDGLPESVTRIVLRINSPGGEVFEGLSILNMFRAHKATVTAVVDGLAASAASFIAVGCDETVMSPGTQMMIHSPLVFAYGNAAELRKTAQTLDSIESSIIDIYSDKAGERDWPALLSEDTWMPAKEAVAMGLADRVAVIPDAGETLTAGESESLDLDVPEDRFVNAAPNPSGPGINNRKEHVVDIDVFLAGVRDRLGINDADAAPEAVLSALDEALTEQAEPATITLVPEGAVVVDKAALAELQASAAEGVAARQEQNAARRDGIIAAALTDGRIAPAAQAEWRKQLDKDEDGVKALLEAMPKNTIPVTEIGHSDDVKSSEDTLYGKVYPTSKEA